MTLRCRLGYHDWNLAFRRVGETQHCSREGCDAIAYATNEGWFIGRLHREHAPKPQRIYSHRTEVDSAGWPHLYPGDRT